MREKKNEGHLIQAGNNKVSAWFYGKPYPRESKLHVHAHHNKASNKGRGAKRSHAPFHFASPAIRDPILHIFSTQYHAHLSNTKNA